MKTASACDVFHDLVENLDEAIADSVTSVSFRLAPGLPVLIDATVDEAGQSVVKHYTLSDDGGRYALVEVAADYTESVTCAHPPNTHKAFTLTSDPTPAPAFEETNEAEEEPETENGETITPSEETEPTPEQE